MRPSTSLSAPPMTPATATGLFGVGDHQHVGLKLALAAVDECQLLAGPGAADDDAPSAELVEVEGVQRLAHLQHDVVRYVDDVVDRAHAGGEQALLHPRRRLADLHALDERGDVARAEISILDLDARRGP